MNFYSKAEVDSAIAVVDGKALNNFNDINAINTNLTDNYQTNSQLATNYYNKGEVDTLIAGAGGGVSNPIELVDANTSIERYTNASKSNIFLRLINK